ncbi:MAG: carbohydrate ABC transporter substrate-binding protein, partial [Eubacteriales bacterium]|nr:carbohydrate ABC transporter substrate-binding protein [Eubacteriales bacterium]MDD3197478.1 carbohydrate ABC transporter substrate-binding protein [Eubacteriales bacterium]MDD4682753.1 carbohydrate ABC transporter substrate-binding protein [Eubacteriales bacterium]
MNKKMISLLLSIVMLLSVVTACAGNDDSTTTTTTAPAGDETTTEGESDETTAPADFAGKELSILVSQGWMDNHYDGIIARFEEEYSVTVDLQTIPADQYEDLL